MDMKYPNNQVYGHEISMFMEMNNQILWFMEMDIQTFRLIQYNNNNFQTVRFIVKYPNIQPYRVEIFNIPFNADGYLNMHEL